jgi:hypothetical protein
MNLGIVVSVWCDGLLFQLKTQTEDQRNSLIVAINIGAIWFLADLCS